MALRIVPFSFLSIMDSKIEIKQVRKQKIYFDISQQGEICSLNSSVIGRRHSIPLAAHI